MSRNIISTISLDQRGFKKYFQNTSWLLAEKIFRLLVSFLVGVWLARYLGPSDYGVFQFAVSLVSIFSAMSALGLDVVSVRELISRPEDSNQILGTTFLLNIIGALLCFMLLTIVIILLDSNNETSLIVLIIGLSIFFNSFLTIDYYFKSIVKSQFILYANSVTLTTASVIKISLILWNAELVYFAWVVSVESMILAMSYCYFYMKTNRGLKSFLNWSFRVAEAKRLLKDSWPQIFSGTMLVILSRIDQVMIKEFVGNEEVAFYSVALRIVEIFAFVPIIFQNSLLPSLINSKKTSLSLYINRLKNYYRLNFTFAILTVIPIYFLADVIVLTMFGNQFREAIPILMLLSFRAIIGHMGIAKNAYMTIENLLKFSMMTIFFGTLVNVVLNYYLIPIYHSEGAIISTYISLFVTVIMLDFFHKKARKNIMLMLNAMLTFFLLKVNFIKSDTKD